MGIRTATVTQLTRWTDASGRGRTSDRLARLRQLGLVGFSTTRGRRGSVRWWFHPAMRRGIATSAVRRRAVDDGNDSTSPCRGFLTRGAWEKRELETRDWTGGVPPGAAGIGGVAGPRRGRRPPRVLYARCPSGHRLRIGRTSWTSGVRELRAEWRGSCRRCGGVPVLETVVLRRPLPEARPPSPAELRDPELLARRRRLALELVEDPGTDPGTREALVRTYLRTPRTRPPP
jgi:hypothetical protein